MAKITTDNPKAGDATGTAGDAVVIRKYANRRLYNTATGSFVTLDGLHKMVVEGETFVVVDARTGNDITASVLTQIVAEQESRGESLLPLDLLRQAISLYDKGLGGHFSTYLNQSMEGFAHSMEQVQRLGDIGRRNMELFQRSFGMFAPGAAWKSPEGDRGAAKPGDSGDHDEEVRHLREQLAEMQCKLDAMSNGGPKD
ncbi:MAG: polyhydroxyalkanoate synthesis repressor PhaR [Alphaproteobacteria bacterium]|nr:polyhydroxyalkanoate synthesis repressor PhaR [Alphaproteobacteria bacterium]